MSNTTLQPAAAGAALAGAAPQVLGYQVGGAALTLTGNPPGVVLSLSGPCRQAIALPGGLFSCMNITAAIIVKSGPAILNKIFCSTSGSISIHDCSVQAAAVVGNLICTAAMTGGAAPIDLNWPISSGICVSSASGVFSLSFT